MLISQYLVGLGLLAFLVVLFVGNVPWQLKCSIFSFSFVIFLLRHFYDMLLLKINPTGLELTLQQ